MSEPTLKYQVPRSRPSTWADLKNTPWKIKQQHGEQLLVLETRQILSLQQMENWNSSEKKLTDQLNSSCVKGQILIMELKQFLVKRTVTKECFVWEIKQKHLASYTYGRTEYIDITKCKLIPGDVTRDIFTKEKPTPPMHS